MGINLPQLAPASTDRVSGASIIEGSLKFDETNEYTKEYIKPEYVSAPVRWCHEEPRTNQFLGYSSQVRAGSKHDNYIAKKIVKRFRY